MTVLETNSNHSDYGNFVVLNEGTNEWKEIITDDILISIGVENITKRLLSKWEKKKRHVTVGVLQYLLVTPLNLLNLMRM